MDISIILVNYNTYKMTQECIESIKKHTLDVSYEIIVVDNASTDESKRYFEYDKSIRYIYNTENVGFGRANNIGISVAKGNYIFMLNTDTLLENNACKMFLDYEQSHGLRMVLGAWLQDAHGNIIHSHGSFPSKRTELANAIRVYTARFPFSRTKQKKLNVYNDTDVDYITGADLFVPRSILEEFGMFDPRFFMYYEESDLQRRLANVGVPRRVIQGPIILHLEHGSQEEAKKKVKSMRKLRMTTSSMLIYIRKYSNLFTYLLFVWTYVALRIFPMIFNQFTWQEKLSYFQLFFKKVKH